MAENGQNQHFLQTDCCYLDYFCQCYSFYTELRKIYSFGPFNLYTGAIAGQNQAKNGLKWRKLAFSSLWSLLFGIFLPISLKPLRTRKNILIWTIKHSYRGHNRPINDLICHIDKILRRKMILNDDRLTWICAWWCLSARLSLFDHFLTEAAVW